MTAKSALAFAASRIGYRAPNDPLPGSEAGRWLAKRLNQSWLAGPSTSIWWCMCFASMCVYESGGSLPGGPTYNTNIAVNAARREGRLVTKGNARPGDLLIFDWNFGTSATDHVGIMEMDRGTNVQAIEGNTSPGTAGSQSAGNGVYRRVRPWAAVRYVIRPSYVAGPSWTPKPAPVQKLTKTDGQYMLDVDGSRGSATNSRWQQVMGTPIDGRIDSPSLCVKATQRFLNAQVSSDHIRNLTGKNKLDTDGLLGPRTVRVLQFVLFNWYAKAVLGRTINVALDCNGSFGSTTTKLFQHALNNSYANSGKIGAK